MLDVLCRRAPEVVASARMVAERCIMVLLVVGKYRNILAVGGMATIIVN